MLYPTFWNTNIYESMGSMDWLHESHLASDSMYFSEEGHSLLFFLMPFSEDLQCGWLGHVQSVQVRSVLSETFGLVFLSLFWLRLYRGFGYALGIFQGLRVKDREREMYVNAQSLIIVYCTSCSQKWYWSFRNVCKTSFHRDLSIVMVVFL